jgi:hypothetical protein
VIEWTMGWTQTGGAPAAVLLEPARTQGVTGSQHGGWGWGWGGLEVDKEHDCKVSH